MPPRVKKQPSAYNLFVKSKFEETKKMLESSGLDHEFSDVIKKVAKMWKLTKTTSPKCTKRFSAHCAEKGKVCHQNAKRRGCRTPKVPTLKKQLTLKQLRNSPIVKK